MTNKTITRKLLPINQRINHTAKIFDVHFPMRFEPFVYHVTEIIAPEYSGGYWDFYTLNNGGFYMAPDSDKSFQVICENGFEGMLSGDALGITVCLYAYSHLSFGDQNAFTDTCANQYHWLRDFMLGHAEVLEIPRAVD